MESNNKHHIEKTNFDAFVHVVGSEIEQAQVRLITAANTQMLFHYWKMGNYILYHQNLQGWGSKIIKQLAKAIRLEKPLMLSLQLALHQIGQIYIAERFLSKHPKKYTLYSIGFDCNFALAKTIKP